MAQRSGLMPGTVKFLADFYIDLKYIEIERMTTSIKAKLHKSADQTNEHQQV